MMGSRYQGPLRYTLHLPNNSHTEILPLVAVMSTTQIAKIQLQPSRPADYIAYVPVKLGSLTTVAFIDSVNTFANVISPETMNALGISTAQLEPVPQQQRFRLRAVVLARAGQWISPETMNALGISTAQLEPVRQLSVGTAAAGKRMKILGQAPRINLQLGQHPAKFRICPLVLQGLVHPVNICGPFLARARIDQIHFKEVLRVCGKEVPMCPSQSPPGLSKTPETSSIPRVCTLHVAESSRPRLQYVPRGPLLDAHLGVEGAKIPGRSRAVLPVRIRPYLSAGALVLIQPPEGSPLGDNPILQEV